MPQTPVGLTDDPLRSRHSPARAVIAAKGLSASYAASTVWSDADFTVAPGEFVAVLGPNGAGKTTLFRILLGLLRPMSGDVTVLGRPPRRGNPAIGYVPQRRPVDPELRLAGTELVKLGLTGRRWGIGLPMPRDEVGRRVGRRGGRRGRRRLRRTPDRHPLGRRAAAPRPGPDDHQRAADPAPRRTAGQPGRAQPGGRGPAWSPTWPAPGAWP